MPPVDYTEGMTLESSAGVSDVTGGSDGGDSMWAGLGDLFSSLGTTIAKDYTAISGPTTVRPGQLIYNPNTGQVTNTSQILPQGSGGMLILIGIAILVVVLLLRR